MLWTVRLPVVCALLGFANATTGTIPGSLQVLDAGTRASLQPPRSKSPRKTFLQSPARHNPAMGRGSSVDATDSVVRQLNFSHDESTQVNRLVSPNRLEKHFEEEEDESIAPIGGGIDEDTADFQDRYIDDEPDDDELPANGVSGVDDDGNVDEASGVVQDDEEPQSTPVPSPKVTKVAGKQRGRPRKAKAAEPPARKVGGRGKKPGRPAGAKPAFATVQEEEAAAPADVSEEIVAPRSKRRKLSPPAAEQPKLGRGRPATGATAQEGPKSLEAGRIKKVKAPKPVASSPAEVVRQPPRPNAHSGLFISRRENPNGLMQTRSGRHSFKPLAHWRNERVIYEESDIPHQQAGHYNTIAKQSIADIVRVDELEPPKRSHGGSRGRGKVNGTKSKKRPRVESDDEDEDEEEEFWESEPGRITGDVRVFDPLDPNIGTDDVILDELAISNAAIQTRDVPGASFKFTKCVTTNFFGSGMIELPPGGIKKPKNSRRMLMNFLVFSGRVKVTVHKTEFRIGKGGMFNVPRGESFFPLGILL